MAQNFGKSLAPPQVLGESCGPPDRKNNHSDRGDNNDRGVPGVHLHYLLSNAGRKQLGYFTIVDAVFVPGHQQPSLGMHCLGHMHVPR